MRYVGPVCLRDEVSIECYDDQCACIVCVFSFDGLSIQM